MNNHAAWSLTLTQTHNCNELLMKINMLLIFDFRLDFFNNLLIKKSLVFWTRNFFFQYLFYVLKSIWIDLLKWIFLQITQIKSFFNDFCHLFKLFEYVIFIEKYIFFVMMSDHYFSSEHKICCQLDLVSLIS